MRDKARRMLGCVVLAMTVAATCGTLRAANAVPVDLGTAANFGVLAGGAITGSGNIAGNVGSGSGAIAPAITSTGTIYPTGHIVATTALTDFATAYNEGKNRTPDFILSAAAYELGGTTLTPGVHKIGAAASLGSSVTFNAGGDPKAVFIIQIIGAFSTTASVGNVILTNEANSANVFWIVEGAVSVGANSHMEGNILSGAAIALGASTTLSGRALTSAGAIAIASTISPVTGSPPVGFPPPIVVARTVTDANGNYLFRNVQPGTHIVRWDLSGVSNGFRITTTKQGGDDALDSDSASGEVGGPVDSREIVVLGGTTNLGVDLGLLETLPAIKAAAIGELASARVTYLLANSYTAENWEVLRTAMTVGGTAINAAADAAGVAMAKAAALAAMDAVPTFSETLAAAKATALGELASARVTYLEADYTAEDWTKLTTAHTNGTLAIQAATDLARVATAKAAALAAMDAVPGVAEIVAFTNISRTPEGEVTLVLKMPLTLQTSTNLTNPLSWTTIGTVTPGNATWTLVHPAGLATGPMRFYRAVTNP